MKKRHRKKFLKNIKIWDIQSLSVSCTILKLGEPNAKGVIFNQFPKGFSEKSLLVEGDDRLRILSGAPNLSSIGCDLKPPVFKELPMEVYANPRALTGATNIDISYHHDRMCAEPCSKCGHPADAHVGQCCQYPVYDTEPGRGDEEVIVPESERSCCCPSFSSFKDGGTHA